MSTLTKLTPLSCAAVCLSSAVAAQNVNTNNQAFELEEIIVTATKTAKSLQDIGLSVTAVEGHTLRERGIVSMEDLMKIIPNTSFNSPAGGGVPVVIIRGVGLQNFRINDSPTTAIYVDEVYQTSVAEARAALFDLERVEVLKGPQGGLYGRNAVGGAIQVVSAQPNFNEMEGYVSASAEKYERYETEAVISGPITDTVAFRLGGKMIKANDGYFHSVPGNFDHGADDRWAARAQLAFQPSNTVSVSLKVHGGGDQSDLPLPQATGAYNRLGLNLGNAIGLPGTADGAILTYRANTTSLNYICDDIIQNGTPGPNCETVNGLTMSELGLNSRYDSYSISKPRLDNSWWGSSLLAEAKFDEFTFTSISAYDSFEHIRIIDQDTLDVINQEIDYDTDIDAWSQEFRLSYEGDGNFSWVVGVNYAEDDLVEDSILYAGGLLSAALGGATIVKQDYEQDTSAFAIYGHSDWNFADSYNLVFEARYTEEDKSFVGGATLPQANRTLSFADDDASYSAVSGKIGIEYKPNTDSLAYFSISKGFKSGGFFGGFATSNLQLEDFDQEEIWAYELGYKTELPAQAMRINSSVFYYDRTDVQANGRDLSGAVPIARLSNIGDVESYGAELEVSWFPTQHWRIQGSLAYVKSEIIDSDKTGGDPFRVERAVPFEGKRLSNQPEFSANFTFRYEDQLSQDLDWNAQLEYSYRSEQDQGIIFTEASREFMTEDPYSLVNLRGSIKSSSSNWTTSLYINNLFDEKYRTNAGGAGPTGLFEIYGAPRIYGAQVSYQF